MGIQGRILRFGLQICWSKNRESGTIEKNLGIIIQKGGGKIMKRGTSKNRRKKHLKNALRCRKARTKKKVLVLQIKKSKRIASRSNSK